MTSIVSANEHQNDLANNSTHYSVYIQPGRAKNTIGQGSMYGATEYSVDIDATTIEFVYILRCR